MKLTTTSSCDGRRGPLGTPLDGSIGHDLWPLSVGSSGYVTLHKESNVPSKTDHELGDQLAGPFKVIRALPNAYELALPPTWAVHPFATEIPSPVYSADGNWGDMGRGKPKYYLRRRNLAPAWDVWRPAVDVEAYVPKLVKEYDDEQRKKNN
ncbi:hypothetical protein PENPOL_c025G00439 [Penicillium polonicum]|uniref:Uncharacterized protein n=1 Tax=Penicillium polonicum TaxID=60169 RepID=A0A1V6N6L0_PENPO|nr:hypothetical protein PENPOL_c025G00439 [Penicillium polonicum]